MSGEKVAFGRAFAGLLLTALCWLCVGAPIASAAPEVAFHDLDWFVHIDLIEPGAGRDLAYWQGVLDDAVATANSLVEGGHGPFDEPCCTRLGRSVSVATFGSPGDGLDVVSSSQDQNAIALAGNDGSRAYLVDSMTYCGGPTGAIGCASTPSCSSNANDDPNLWMIVTVESFDAGTLGSVIAHERGHNACLAHIATAECQLMQAVVFTPGLGGCLSNTECTRYRQGRTQTTSGLECGCHETGGGIVADGTVCADAVGGVCSGGLCGEISGDAGVQLFVAAGPGTAGVAPPDDALRVSGLSGDWTTVAQFNPTADDVRGLAYATDSGTLYGVVPTVADDAIVTIDPVAGTILSTVGVIGNGSDEFVSMAYDPGPTSAPGDDRLLLLQVGGLPELRSIDPASPNTTTFLGFTDFGSAALVTGMAYDSIQDLLYFSTPFIDGILEMDLASCTPSPCDTVGVPGSDKLFRTESSLAYSAKTGMLYLIGTAFSGQRTFYNVIDPKTGVSTQTLSLDVFAPGGLAAVPEPGFGTGLLVGAILLGSRGRRRSRERMMKKQAIAT